MALLLLEHPQQAIEAFERARTHGYRGAGFSHAFAYAVQDDWEGVERVLASRVPTGVDSGEVLLPDQQALLAIDRGDWGRARAQAAEATAAATSAEPLVAGTWQRIRQLAVDVASGQLPRAEAEARIAREMDRVEEDAARLDAAFASASSDALQALGYLAALVDARRPLARAIVLAERFHALDDYPLMVQLQAVLEAELARVDGRPLDAANRLRGVAAGDDAMVVTHFSLQRALAAAGDAEGAGEQAAWLDGHRGRAYIERPGNDLLSPVAVAARRLAYVPGATTPR